MRVFHITGFTGRWPVGTSAVVVAENLDQAKFILEAKLVSLGLKQTINRADICELDTTCPHAVILQDGDY